MALYKYAIDGKTARRSFTTKERKNALHTVSAWSCQHQLVLGQTAVDSKTNEITAIPELLTMLDIENSIITLDAMGCQHSADVEAVQQILEQRREERQQPPPIAVSVPDKVKHYQVKTAKLSGYDKLGENNDD